jgi:hypothetical protein
MVCHSRVCLPLLFLLAIMLVAISGSSPAEAFPKLNESYGAGDDGRCPTKADFASGTGGDEEPLVAIPGKDEWEYRFVIAPDEAILRRDWPANALPVVNNGEPRRLDVLKKVKILGEPSSSSASGVFLVQSAGTEVCGWVNENAFGGVEYDEAGPVVLSEDEAPEKRRKPGSTIGLKAVAHNLNIRGELIKTYSLPDRSSEIFRKLKQFAFLDVFTWREDPENAGKYFYLIGRETALGVDAAMLGWAHEDDITIWSTCMMAYWTGTGRGMGYAGPQRERPVLEEPDSLDIDPSAVGKYYPVVRSRPSNNTISTRIESGEIRPATVENILKEIIRFHLIVPGRACTQDGNCISAAELDKLKQRVDEAQRKLNRIDIVFLIDGTSSMSPYFASVAKGVEKFVGRVGIDARQAQINVSAVLYGDYNGRQASLRALAFEPVVPHHFLGNTSSFMERLVRRASPDRTISDDQEDKLEATFAAILRSSHDETLWDTDDGTHRSGLRYVVHIGDHGNRELGEGPSIDSGYQLSSGLDEKFSIERVIDRLRSEEIVYVPVAINNPEAPQASKRFRDQARRILSALGQTGEGRPGPSRPLVIESGNQRAVTAAVVEALRSSVEFKDSVLRVTARVRACAETYDTQSRRNQCIEEIKRTGGSGDAQIVDNLDETVGLTKEQIANIYAREQTTLPVWVPPLAQDEETLEYWLLIPLPKVDRLWGMVDRLCRAVRPGVAQNEGRRAIRDLMRFSGELVTGDNPVTPTETFAKAFYIPAWALSPFLGRGWDTIREAASAAGSETYKRWNKHICRSAYLLDLAINNDRKINDLDRLKVEWNDNKNTHVYKTVPDNITKFKWTYNFGDGNEFYLIPLSFLP